MCSPIAFSSALPLSINCPQLRTSLCTGYPLKRTKPNITPTITPSIPIIHLSLNSSSPSSPSSPSDIENVLIIGSGPAGYTAAIYAGRANLKPVLLEGLSSGVPGGQLMTTSEIENYPGFPNGITGPQLMTQMRDQSIRWGAQIISDDAISVDLDTQPYIIHTSQSGVFKSHAVIIATGASAKRLGVKGETTLWGRGISACAICDGAAPIFAGVPIAVVGGGDSACEEAVYLCKYASQVHLLVRSAELRASRTLRDRVINHPRVHLHFNTTVVEAIGGNEGNGSPLTALMVKKADTGEQNMLQVRGLFYAIGHRPNTKFLKGSSRLRFDPMGYLLTDPGTPHTGQDGVFAAGDVADAEWRQAVTAAGSGCTAALAAERYLAERGLLVEYHHQQEQVLTSKGEDVSEEERRVYERGSDDESNYDVETTWHVGQYALRKLYHESKRPLIVKYVSSGCGPCRQLKPMLNAVVRELEGKVHYVEIDIGQDSEIAEAAGVTGSPTVQIFFEKSLVKELKGVKMKSEYRKEVERVLNGVKVA